MTRSTPAPPGTVSRILWHFTGGPDWDEHARKQKARRKPAHRAYAALKSILRTRELRLGNYREVITVVVAERRRFNVKTRQPEVLKNVRVRLESAPICCLSDIPAAHLGHHATRYGKFAIGFHRASVVAHGFNPVFYTLDGSAVLRAAYAALNELDFIDPLALTDAASEIRCISKTFTDDQKAQVQNSLSLIEAESKYAGNCLAKAKGGVYELLSFVKSFSEDDFDSIYCEREWRSLTAYRFAMDDVAMIVIPKALDSRQYFADFVKRIMPTLEVPRTVPVVPWEDLVEQ